MPLSLARTAALATALPALAFALAASCSLQNREGPDVSCADLQCGRVNACAEGIIAQCADGQTVRYHVCSPHDEDVCDEPWQLPGQYRCTESTTVCEGCDPAGPGCPPVGSDAGLAGGGGSIGPGGSGGEGSQAAGGSGG
jgi:hypothetical protein